MQAGVARDWQELLSSSLKKEYWPDELTSIVRKLSIGEPINRADAHFLFQYSDLNTIGKLANLVKRSMFGSKVFFNHNVHINQTNICTLACKFCAFRRGRRADDAYQMEVQDYLDDLNQYANYVDEVHSVGGLHPDWDIEHYELLFSETKNKFPCNSVAFMQTFAYLVFQCILAG